MPNKDTIVVVGATRADEYGNLWVTPAGGGDEVKIAAKREQLHNLFQQGKAVMLHWETYKNRPYVSDAKPVEGELPEPQSPHKVLPEHKEVIDEITKTKPAPQELGMWWKELGEMIRAKEPTGLAMKDAYYTQMFSVLPIKVEEAKGETIKDNKATIQQEEGLGPKSTSGEALELLPGESERVRGFLERLMEHNIQAPRLFLEVEYAIPHNVPLSDTQCELLYKTIKTKEKW